MILNWRYLCRNDSCTWCAHLLISILPQQILQCHDEKKKHLIQKSTRDYHKETRIWGNQNYLKTGLKINKQAEKNQIVLNTKSFILELWSWPIYWRQLKIIEKKNEENLNGEDKEAKREFRETWIWQSKKLTTKDTDVLSIALALGLFLSHLSPSPKASIWKAISNLNLLPMVPFRAHQQQANRNAPYY